jgi:hypothetical protein
MEKRKILLGKRIVWNGTVTAQLINHYDGNLRNRKLDLGVL